MLDRMDLPLPRTHHPNTPTPARKGPTGRARHRQEYTPLPAGGATRRAHPAPGRRSLRRRC
ncbi:hypothetical protein B0T16DRAFT_400634 [Cercophora newfieldiana]|uniref:Uncharacterized protein n=1 Tax=Cercophora newfieldiana TaxID=92897 RepID=A0AA40CZ52_9PEZI|nr:hypothetical protein B0T16DRAFT_400634 [Cercophora newfieldiana]